MNRIDSLKTPEELFIYMKNHIKYGFVSSKDGKVYHYKDFANDFEYRENLFRNYTYQTPQDTVKNRCGMCFDQVELIKYWLMTHNYQVETYLTDYLNHAIVIYQDYINKSFNIMERTEPGKNGIYRGETFEEVIDKYIRKVIKNNELTTLYLYEDIPYGIDLYDFIITAKNSKKILTLK